MRDISNPSWEDEYDEFTEDEDYEDDEASDEDEIDWSEVEKVTPPKEDK